jgi:uncharacterized membrane protein YphA (DoxX/SURF4 family)
MTSQQSAVTLSASEVGVRRLLGAVVFVVGIGAFAVQNFLVSDFINELQPAPVWLPARALMAYLNGAAVLVAMVCILAGIRVRLAALWLSLVLAIWIAFHVVRLIANPSAGGAWTGAMEIFAMAGAALMLASLSPPDPRLSAQWNARIDGIAALGMFCFAITLPGFGAQHFIYRDYVASVIPAWIPAHMFWAYFTGVAHIATGIAILTSLATGYVRLARLAAKLFTIMVGLWALILHVPRVLANIESRPEWTSMFVAVALCGGGMLMIETLSKEKLR